MLVIPVASRRDTRRFVDLPYRLHHDAANWVPPLRRQVFRFFDGDHPYYVHSEAGFFIAEDDGAVVARIGVHEDVVFNRVRGRRWGFFHLFEAADDAAGRAVLEAAAAWARERRLERLVGPRGFLPGEGIGFMVEGFDVAGSMALDWHPPRYSRLVEAAGFSKETDYLSGTIPAAFDVPEAIFAMADAAAAGQDLEILHLRTRRELREWAPAIGRVYNEAFAGNWEFRPVEPAEIREITDTFLPIVDPRLIVLLMDRGEPAGFLLVLPDVADGLRRARGRLLPLGWWHVLRSRRRTTRVEFEGLAVIPRLHGTGANTVIYADVARRAAVFPRYRSAEMIRVDEGNTRMQRNVAAIGATFDRRHRVYGRAL